MKTASDKNSNSPFPLISVIIPVYKVEAVLDRCLQSVAGQDYKNFEAILVDDGSPDRCGEICDRWAKKDQRFKAFHKENGGLSDARNYGIEHSTGEYLSFLDSDDTLEPACLSYLYNLLKSTKGCRVAQANHNIIRGAKTEKNSEKDQDAVFSQHDAAKAVLFHDRVDVTACSKLYERSVFEDLRFPKGRLFEDTWLFGDILKKTETYAWGRIPQYNYVMNPNSIIHQSFKPKNLEYIEAAERLAKIIQTEFPDLEAGCIRRVNHARLSVLRYMKDCGEEYKQTREGLRKAILQESKAYIHLPETPKRDKLAVQLLKLGWTPFYTGWDLYTRLRKI